MGREQLFGCRRFLFLFLFSFLFVCSSIVVLFFKYSILREVECYLCSLPVNNFVI
jgi:hypothetical protein